MRMNCIASETRDLFALCLSWPEAEVTRYRNIPDFNPAAVSALLSALYCLTSPSTYGTNFPYFGRPFTREPMMTAVQSRPDSWILTLGTIFPFFYSSYPPLLTYPSPSLMHSEDVGTTSKAALDRGACFATGCFAVEHSPAAICVWCKWKSS